MSTPGLARMLCGCGGLFAAEGLSSRGRGGEKWKSSTRQAMVYASGARMSRFLLGQMGPQQQQQGRYGSIDGLANSVTTQKEFGLNSSNGLGRRAGADFLCLVARAAAGDKAGLSDGDNGSGSGGILGGDGGGGGGGGAGGNNGPGDVPGGGGEGGHLFPSAGVALWIWYNNALETHPLVSKSLTAGLMNAFADLFCQVFIEKVDAIDWKRIGSFMSIGLFMSGPGLHFWYGLLPRIVPIPGFAGVLLRIGLDQLIFTPLGMISFFVVLCTLEDRRDDIRGKLEKDVWPTVIDTWKVWIPFQIVNFGFIPPQLQVASASLLGMVWSVFMSYKGHT